MPESGKDIFLQRCRLAQKRRRFVLRPLAKPRTQAELRDALGLSNSGILHLLRHLERDGLARPAEKVGWTRIWERCENANDKASSGS